ncbi:kynurenine formamidase isoform X2 [Panulirus ornatus]|uniref:kynurenine formamidase isoform X2 n=1 Tax=Panulirus ornatus TaxID=150431 RepID=UPI003A849C89
MNSLRNKQMKGPGNPQWRSMNVEELELQYSPSKWSKRLSAEEIISADLRVTQERSQAAKRAVKHRLNISYAEGPLAKLDVFGEDLPQVSVEKIVAEVEAAVIWTCKLARERGSKGVFLAGWSAGGQLITQVLSKIPFAAKNSQDTNLTLYKDLILGGVTISGVFDLRPLVSTYVNDPLQLTESTAWALSPLSGLDRLSRTWPKLRLLVAVGEQDSPEFRRQSWQYTQKCKTSGLKAEYVEVDGVDHFNIVEDLARKDFSLVKKILAFVETCVKDRKLKEVSK